MQDKATAYGVYLAYIDDYLRELGEDSRAVFEAAGIADPAAIQQGERVTVDALAAVMSSVNRLTHRRGFFLEVGARIPIMAHGALGSAIMACKDVRTVLTMLERYAAIVLPSVRVTLHADQEDVVLEYQISTPSAETNIALVEALIGTTGYNMSLLTAQPFFPKKVYVTVKAPPYADKFRAFTQCEVEFNASSNRLVFSQAQLDLPIKTANALSQRFMVQQCEVELKKVQSSTQLTERIREITSLYLDASPSIGFVAEKLRISERTLRRRLNEESMNFRDLLKAIRHETALYYLGKTDMRIESIAWRLGYKETANFRKAFKEAAGKSPRQWRDEVGMTTPHTTQEVPVNKDLFAHKASSYEQNKSRVDNVENIANSIIKSVVFQKSMTIMDFGSGTGLLLERVAPLVGKITAVDISNSMNRQLLEKRSRLGCDLEILEIDLENVDLENTYDGIISSMTMHHVKDIDAMFAKFYRMLNAGGFIAISDLDSEDGGFHTEDTGVYHFGFDREAIARCAEKAGFSEVVVTTASVVHKPQGDYSVFLLRAYR